MREQVNETQTAFYNLVQTPLITTAEYCQKILLIHELSHGSQTGPASILLVRIPTRHDDRTYQRVAGIELYASGTLPRELLSFESKLEGDLLRQNVSEVWRWTIFSERHESRCTNVGFIWPFEDLQGETRRGHSY